MDNKELPQEITVNDEQLKSCLHSALYQIGHAASLLDFDERGAVVDKVFEITRSHYNSIIDVKDKEIGELEQINEKAEQTLWLTVMAKDGTIEELQEQANKQQQIITEILAQKQQEITAKDSEIERIKGLLRAEIYDRSYSDYLDFLGVDLTGDEPEDVEDEIFEAETEAFKMLAAFCKEHNL